MASLSFFIFLGASESKAANGLEEVYGKLIGTDNIVPIYANPLVQVKARQRTFSDVAKDVKNDEADKADLDTIFTLADEKNPDAVELLAWMNATGTGLPQNLYNAWFLYVEADEMGVPNAKQNAKVIYSLITFQGGKK